MLTAIQRGKAGRVRVPGGECDVSWRDVFRQREDLLTAVFFSRLRYLSDASLAHVMGTLIGEAASELGPCEGVELWPRLERLDGRSWVEPDVLLRFGDAFVMVEVKPPFGGEQSADQWKAELDALLAEFLSGGAAVTVVHFVALGRTSRVPVDALAGFDTKGMFELSVHRVEWECLVECVRDRPAESSRTDAAVFDDWCEAFGLFGLQSPLAHDWMALVERLSAQPLTVDPLFQWGNSHVASDPAPMRSDMDWAALASFCHQHRMEPRLWN